MISNHRIEKAKELLKWSKYFGTPETVLDIGFGSIVELEELKKYTPNLIGIEYDNNFQKDWTDATEENDYEEKPISYSVRDLKRLTENDINIVIGDAEGLVKYFRNIDLVVMIGSWMEWYPIPSVKMGIHNKQKFLDEIHEVLSPTGRIVIHGFSEEQEKYFVRHDFETEFWKDVVVMKKI